MTAQVMLLFDTACAPGAKDEPVQQRKGRVGSANGASWQGRGEAMIEEIAILLHLPPGPYIWGHGYYSVLGEVLQQPRWRIETSQGYQFFAPALQVARKGDIVVASLAGLQAGWETDATVQERILAHLHTNNKE